MGSAMSGGTLGLSWLTAGVQSRSDQGKLESGAGRAHLRGAARGKVWWQGGQEVPVPGQKEGFGGRKNNGEH